MKYEEVLRITAAFWANQVGARNVEIVHDEVRISFRDGSTVTLTAR